MQAEGGLLPSEEVAQRLGITRQAVDVRRQKGQLVAWRVADKWRFPCGSSDKMACPCPD